ncbi:PIH1 domain-containing protein [Plasmodium gonderi]|uniref:PIH1 domain-containing protein n=1 Tax=Plasmodium gonderi TaxID=77519 RepID=A0A1Y1JQF6_PLAGO|nr:PIH1 domain-containing protein [Plasmodium gonderi]GAW83725.1 PIH1 domain-containing protein [Plasmodium gonderi]
MDKFYDRYFKAGERNFEFSTSSLINLVKNEKTIKISPQKGFVIKTYDKDGGKVYFNILSSSLIAEFHLKKMPDLNDNEGLRIPLSIGEEKQKEDKKGNKYKTYDIVLNSSVVSQCKKNVELKKVIAELVQVAIKNKYKMDTCTNLFFFPEHKYKGSTPDDQYIKDDQQHKFNVVQEEVKQDEQENSGGGRNKGTGDYLPDCLNNRSNNNEMKDLLNKEDIENFLSVKKPEWDMWFVDKKTLEERHRKLTKFYVPYLRTFPMKDKIDCFDFKPPFLNSNKNKKNKKISKNENFKSFLNDYNIELDDEFLRYQQVINTICVIQIQLPFFVLAQRNGRNEDEPFFVHHLVNLYISDEHLGVFFKKSPVFPPGHNPPYKNFNIRFPFYFESSKAISHYLEKYHLLNIIIPVNKSSAICEIFNGNLLNKDEGTSSDVAESSDNSIF